MSFLQPFPLGYVAQPQPGIGIIQLSILAESETAKHES